MHAVVVDVEIQDMDAARKGLEEQVIPSVKQAPGFQAGYWIRLAEGRGTSVLIFDTEEHARAAAPAPESASQGAKLTGITVGEVVASA